MALLYALLILAGVVCFFYDGLKKAPSVWNVTSIGLGLVFLVPLIQYFKQV